MGFWARTKKGSFMGEFKLRKSSAVFAAFVASGMASASPATDRIDVPGAHRIHTGTRDTLVALLDTGLNADVEPMRSALSATPGYNFVDRRPETPDGNGHGTYTASLILQVAPNISLLPIKVLSDVGAGENLDIRQGLSYARLKNAQVIVMSFGGGHADPLMCDAISEALDEGRVVIVPAGNDAAADVGSRTPAGCDDNRLIVVAASSDDDQLERYSSFDPVRVAFAAPGHKVAGLDRNGQAWRLTGTSPATALAAGAAALLKSFAPHQGPGAIRAALEHGVDVFADFQGKVSSGGRLNVRRALEALQR